MNCCSMVFLIMVLAVVVPTDYMGSVVAAVCVFTILYNIFNGGKK
jgi:hypothetical protein